MRNGENSIFGTWIFDLWAGKGLYLGRQDDYANELLLSTWYRLSSGGALYVPFIVV